MKKTYIPAKPRNKKLVNPAGASLSMLRQEISGGYTDGIKQRVDAIEQKVNNTVVGSANLLRNTGFLGDFQSLTVDALTAVTGSTPISTNPLAHWVYSSTEVIDAPSRSGKGVKIGSIQQTVTLKQGSHVLSFWAKGNSLLVDLVESVPVSIDSEYKKYSFDITVANSGAYTLTLSDDAYIYEIMLSEGNADVSYSYSEEDDLKAIAQLQAINVITDAIKNYDTDILGGLILTSMIQLGKYKDGVMEKVNAVISGIYNNDSDPFLIGGGNLEEGIRRILNPMGDSVDENGNRLANFAVDHGGNLYAFNAFIRGVIHATSGYFQGRIESNVDGDRVIIDPATRSIKYIDTNGKLTMEMFFMRGGGDSLWTSFKLYGYMSGKIAQSMIINPIEGITFEYFDANGQVDDSLTMRLQYDGWIKNGKLPKGTPVATLPIGYWYEDANGFIKVKR